MSLIRSSKLSKDVNGAQFENLDYFYCESCRVEIRRCHCTCPYCGERDDCECVLFDLSTGG